MNATFVSLVIATTLGAAAPALADATSLDARFSSRTVVLAGHAIPVRAHPQGVVVRLTSTADGKTIDDAALKDLVARAAVQVPKVPAVSHVESARGDDLRIVWLASKASRETLAAYANALLDDARVDAVFPLTTRNDDGWGVFADRLVVSAHPGALDDVIAALAAVDVTLVRTSRVPHTALFSVGARFDHDAITAANILRIDGVRAIEPELLQRLKTTATVNDPLHDGQWHLHRDGPTPVPGQGQIYAHEAWDVTQGDPSVVIAVIDTGTDVLHADLQENIVGGFDAIDGDDDASPGCSASSDGDGPVASCPESRPYRDSHGTAVAGTIAARGDNDIGLVGVCPKCSIMPIRFIGGGLGSSLTSAETFVRAVDDGAWILNNSWGPGTNLFLPLGTAERDAYDYVRHEGRDGLGAIIVFAAGNDTSNVFADPYAAHPYAIAVAASTNLDDWAAYSNYGNEIDVAAPSRGGTVASDSYGISTTDVSGAEGYDSTDYVPDFGGTSAASPVVAGVVGLLLSAHPTLTAEQVRLVLAAGADKITATVVDWENVIGQDLSEIFAYDENGHSIGFGYGRVNAASTLLKAAELGLQGGPCTEGCQSCALDGACEMACTTQDDCALGTVCEDDFICRSPSPGALDVGQPCQPECAFCTPSLDTSYDVDLICTTTCAADAECPSGFDCRVIDADGTSVCAVGDNSVGERNFYRECRFMEVVRDDAGHGYCSEMCFGNSPGDCPYGFHCGSVTCECTASSPWGCSQYSCTENPFSNWDYDVCVPDDGHGVECGTDFDCAPGDYCQGAIECAPEDLFCTGGGTCVLDDRGGCTVCQPCLTDDECSPQEFCLTSEFGGFCSRGCEYDDDCPGGSVCGSVLSGFNNREIPTCRARGDLPETDQCDAFFTCHVPCRDDVPCGDGEICDDGNCVPAPDSSDAGTEDDAGTSEPEPDAIGPVPMPTGCGCSTTDVRSSMADMLALAVLACALGLRRRKNASPRF